MFLDYALNEVNKLLLLSFSCSHHWDVSLADDISIALLISRRFSYQMVLTACRKSQEGTVALHFPVLPDVF